MKVAADYKPSRASPAMRSTEPFHAPTRPRVDVAGALANAGSLPGVGVVIELSELRAEPVGFGLSAAQTLLQTGARRR